MRTWLMVCLALVLVGGAAAQIPTPTLPPVPSLPVPTQVPNQGTVAIDGLPRLPVNVSVDSPGEFTFTVTNTAAPTTGVLDQQSAKQVSLVVNGIPDAGWTVTVMPAAFTLAAGQKQTVQLKLAVQPDAASDATLQVVAQATNPLGSPQAATGTVHAQRSDGLTRNVLEHLGAWVYALIALIPLLVLVIVLLAVRGRPIGVRLDAPVRTVTLPPGGRGALKLVVANPSRRSQTVLLRASEGDDGWTVLLPEPEVEVPPRGTLDTQLVLVAPKTATTGARRPVTVSAYPADDPRRPARAELEARVDEMARPEPKPAARVRAGSGT